MGLWYLFCFIFQVMSPQKGRDIKKHLLHACEEMKRKNFTKFPDTLSFSKSEWLISERFKLIACKVFKVGSTNIARVLYTLDHLSEQTDSNKVSKGRARSTAILEKENKTEENLEILFKSYKKFMFVRDPLERLLSAYRDHRPPGWFKPNGITFKDYLEQLVTVPDRKMNFHMVSFTRMCNPCRLKYDFIGLTDSYEKDMGNILKSVGADKYVILPHRNQTGYGQNKSDEVLQAHLKDVPKSVIRKIYEKYYWDYFLFGFAKPDF